jgi:hypothetical protein
LNENIVQFYLPPIKYINKDFLKQVLQDKKILLSVGEVRAINVSKFDELSVKRMLKDVLKESEL